MLDQIDMTWIQKGYRLVSASYGPGNKATEVWKRNSTGILTRKLIRFAKGGKIMGNKWDSNDANIVALQWPDKSYGSLDTNPCDVNEMECIVKFSNKTKIKTSDLTFMVRLALKRISKIMAVGFVFNEERSRKKHLSVLMTFDHSANIPHHLFTVTIPISIYKDLERLKSMLGAYIHYYLYLAAWGENTTPDWEFGKKCQLRFKEALPATVAEKSVVQLREEKARKRVANLELKLVMAEKKIKTMKSNLKKAIARVKYYEKRQSKSAKEIDFQNRLKEKVKGLDEFGSTNEVLDVIVLEEKE